MQPRVLQILPALEVGGVERGTLEIGKGLVNKGYGSYVVSAGGKLVNQLENEGSKHFTIDIGKKSPLTFRHIPLLKKIILDNKINIIHVRSRMPAWVAYCCWQIISKEKRPLFMSTVHGPYSVNSYSSIMMKGQRVIAISNYIRNYIITNYPDTDSNIISVIHRGVSSEQYSPDFKPDQQWLKNWHDEVPTVKNRIIITLPARITRWKGQTDFIQIIKKLIDKNIAVHGIIAGGPHSRRKTFYQQLGKMICELGIEEHISLIGSRSDIREIMKTSDIVVSLAKIPEAFGRTALEALCIGTPVVAYDHGGASEVLKTLFPQGLTTPNDIEAAAAKIEEIIKKKYNINESNPFTLESMINKTITLYETALSEQKKI